MWRSYEAALILRLAGAALLTLGGWYIGQSRARRLRRQIHLLRTVAGGLGRMADELSTLCAPLPLILDKLADLPFFGPLHRSFGLAPLPDLWQTEAENLLLPREDVLALSRLGEVAGRCDARRQVAELEMVRRRLDRSADALEVELRGAARSFGGVGAALGAMLAVMLL